MGELINSLSNSIVSFKSAAKVPVEGLKIYFNPIQNGTGSPSPENIRSISGWAGINTTKCGKNLFNKNNSEQILNSWIDGNNKNAPSSVDTTIFIKCKPNTAYTISKIGGVLKFGYSINKPALNNYVSYCERKDGATTYTITTNDTAQYIVAWVCDLSKTTDSNLGRQTILDSIQIEEGFSATVYEPYNEKLYNMSWAQPQVKLKDITNAYGAYAYITFNQNSADCLWNHWGNTGHAGTYGVNTDKNYIYYKKNTYSHWVANGSNATVNYLIYLSPSFSGGYRSLQCIIKHENSIPINEDICIPSWNSDAGGAPTKTWSEIIPLGDGFYLCKVNGLKQDGSNDLIGVSVKPGNKVYFSWMCCEDNKSVCTDWLMYGGNINLINGVLTITHQSKVFNGNESENWNVENWNNIKNFYILVPDAKNGQRTNLYCNRIPSPNSQALQPGTCIISSTRNLNLAVGTLLNISTVEELRAWLLQNNLQVVYELETPITYQLTAEQIDTLIGRNNIISNSNGNIEIQYKFNETKGIQQYKKRIIANSPHLITINSNNNVVNFNTDINAPLKDCKIYFNPIQKGGGTPSLENIRNIMPYTEFEINNVQEMKLLIPQSNVNYSQSGVNLEYLGNGLYHIYGYGDFSTDDSLGFPNIQLAEPFIIPTSADGGKLFLNNSAGGCTIYLKYANGNKIDAWDMNVTNRKINSYAAMANKELTIFSIVVSTYYSEKNIDLFFRPVFMKNLMSNIAIPLPSGVDEVYGGYIDLINGKLVQTYANIDLINQTWVMKRNNDSGPYIFYCTLPSEHNYITQLTATTEHFCNIYPTKYISAWNLAVPEYFHLYRYGNSTPTSDVIYFAFNDISSIEDFQNWLIENNVQVVIKLATPIIHTIDPITLKALRGANNIWSTANGKIESSYWTH